MNMNDHININTEIKIDIENEVWKIIQGYEEEKYEISNFGRVRRWTRKNGSSFQILKEPILIKPNSNNKNGRLRIRLSKNDKSTIMLLYRLVALYFVENPNPNEFNDVDHIDRNENNNHYTNLRWCSRHLNCINTKLPKTNTSGIKGVYWYKATNKWRAAIKVHRKIKHGGYFENIEDAIQKRRELEQQYFDQNFYHNGQ